MCDLGCMCLQVKKKRKKQFLRKIVKWKGCDEANIYIVVTFCFISICIQVLCSNHSFDTTTCDSRINLNYMVLILIMIKLINFQSMDFSFKTLLEIILQHPFIKCVVKSNQILYRHKLWNYDMMFSMLWTVLRQDSFSLHGKAQKHGMMTLKNRLYFLWNLRHHWVCSWVGFELTIFWSLG